MIYLDKGNSLALFEINGDEHILVLERLQLVAKLFLEVLVTKSDPK
jgi:hypothetical protein